MKIRLWAGVSALALTVSGTCFAQYANTTPQRKPPSSAQTGASGVRPMITTWVNCAAAHAVRYATQSGDVGDLADASLGACADEFNAMVSADQDRDAQAAADNTPEFIDELRRDDAQVARRSRAELRQRLMSLIIEVRMKRAASTQGKQR